MASRYLNWSTLRWDSNQLPLGFPGVPVCCIAVIRTSRLSASAVKLSYNSAICLWKINERKVHQHTHIYICICICICSICTCICMYIYIDIEYIPDIWIHLYQQLHTPKAPDCFGRAHGCHCCLGLAIGGINGGWFSWNESQEHHVFLPK